ncbi:MULTISPECIES: flagellar biosynthesis protein FlhF [Paraburkholderia]|uniref:flagellar biosynthesis protein FlhF n=1 Tax=Paraburkholderia TaxID=1822464 RepID=UPI002251ED94|nr:MULTISPECIES: flagellar biosynthesis protein FlhF [Paraburkholderia]MCX4164758.1 flagellar biosynthesis protein FlhF [Paraburkholderia megapolitana]MDN7160251.1 flagellar biosynthesis protein FlhF [Paraburkholderia sp. CHISQ3]MDQ6497298.1 flagellar biosynthesis protein FlhF [Paraburkholderia megapolitana]
MNIRKFIGATTRDALRLVREALGPDAVVLSNRTVDDGTVEIVALADSELASIKPGAAAPAAAAVTAPRAAVTSSATPGAALANPYASGMPDVFSSVFGASPEAGTERMSNDHADAQPVTAIRAPAARAEATRSKDAAAAPRTLAESNPWLIDHARKVAVQAEHGAMTPAVAMAKGLGTPGELQTPTETSRAETPEWAREGAQLAARRAAQRAGIPTTAATAAADEARRMPNPPAPSSASIASTASTAFSAGTAASMTEAINQRVEQIVNDTVMHELASMRGMMEEHFTGLLWADRQRRGPTHAALTKHLFAAGFSAQLVQMMIDNMPETDGMEAGMNWVRSVLATNLPVMENEDELMERGGVFALMGPTGVGKTTTTAKLAARCVMRFGASKVALLTTDSYRIGGHEQLRIFGKILGVSVHAVKDSADLQLALSELRNKHIVLIDTIGMSQRDRQVADQIAMLCRAGQTVQRLLLLNATCHGDTLNEVVQAYQRAPDQQPLAGCILTKLDEATNLGSTLDTVIRYRLPVHYVSTGQKVPENLYVATKKFLIKSAFCIPRDSSPFVPQDDDIPPLLSALSARSTADMHEVRFG